MVNQFIRACIDSEYNMNLTLTNIVILFCIFSLWINNPKEITEYPDYTFYDHFGCFLPSYLPRAFIFDYVAGRAKANNLRRFIRFNTAVRHVDFNDEKNEFSVDVEDLNDGSVEHLTFDRVIVATGHYHIPNMIHIDGVDQFPGRVLHSHDFRGAEEFAGLHVLLIGSRISAEDIALQCVKFGTRLVTISARRPPVELKWPIGIKTAPMTVRVEGRTAHLKDGSSVDDVDAIIFCTGYRHSYPFMAQRFRLQCGVTQCISPNLYKSIFWIDQPNLAYLGTTRYLYTWFIFEIQAAIVRDVFLGRIKLPNQDERQEDMNKWLLREQTTIPMNLPAVVKLQSEYVRDILDFLYTNDENQFLPLAKFNFDKCEIMLKHFLNEKLVDIAGYRDVSYESLIDTEEKRIVQGRKPWIENMDDSMENLLDHYRN